jgi:hypothetical protein
MWNFFILMAIFLVIDVAYLTFWSSVYQFERNLERRTVSSHLWGKAGGEQRGCWFVPLQQE